MHHIYHTEGVILGSKNFGEAGKCYFIFTRDLGMVLASAQGVRKMSSKLRFILQDFAYLKIDLVQGKDIWRVTSASKTNMLEDLVTNSSRLRVFANISRLLKRLLAGEDPNQTLFADFINGLSILEKASSEDELNNLEAVIVLRILHNLGYLSGAPVFNNFVKSPLEEEMIYGIGKNRAEILKEINRALKETQL